VELKNKNILITGASRGLGRALALELGDQGARLILVARPSPELSTLERDLRERGVPVVVLPADVADKKAIYPVAGLGAELMGNRHSHS